MHAERQQGQHICAGAQLPMQLLQHALLSCWTQPLNENNNKDDTHAQLMMLQSFLLSCVAAVVSGCSIAAFCMQTVAGSAGEGNRPTPPS
jgi:hypothetical protein